MPGGSGTKRNARRRPGLGDTCGAQPTGAQPAWYSAQGSQGVAHLNPSRSSPGVTSDIGRGEGSPRVYGRNPVKFNRYSITAP